MSLLSQASSYQSNNYDEGEPQYSSQMRKPTGGKTIKKRPINGVEVEKKKCIETLMQMTSGSDDEDDSGLADFQPPSKPELTRVPVASLSKQHPSSYSSNNSSSQPSAYSTAHATPANLQIDLNNAIASVKNAYQHNGVNYNYQGQSLGQGQPNISEQLNYIIHLLEEQQNTKTSTTTEELILYTFLGVFTIYIVDSFTKTGKAYTR